MAGNNEVAFPDRRARITFLFHQQLRRVLDAEHVEHDPGEMYKDRVWELELGYTACPHYLQSDFRENYARKHAADLIARRDDIMASFRVLHQDQAFIFHLRERFPHLYLLAKWETICLALAEKFEAASLPDGTLPPTPAPAKRKLTPEEFRAHLLRRQQIQADDKIALATDRLEAVLKARKFLDQYDLDEDERQQYERELTADLMAGEEQPTTTNHNQPATGYKQL